MLVSFWILCGIGMLSAQDTMIGDVSDGNRSRDVHVIRLIDHDSSTIWPNEQPLLPFSPKNTCGACHDYSKIAAGWHFNAGNPEIPDGRSGQPWIYSDPFTLTQLPLSYRSWEGAIDPAEPGIKPFDFFSIFGRHGPGGGIGEDESVWDKDRIIRWWISGPVEVNCLICHDASPASDPSQYAANMLKQNFRWAAAAASDFALVTGSAKAMPDNYDIYRGTAPDEAQKQPPKVVYDVNRFNPENKVFFDITTSIPDQNCYFCHSQTMDDSLPQPREDVHLKAGLSCVDCHTNGLDHMIDRGSESGGNNCRSCHYESGRYGAPIPDHKGLPPFHLDEIACTACHAGPLPTEHTRPVKTSMAHALGVHGINKAQGVMPHIKAPVYSLDRSGMIIPGYMLWPSFWGELSGDSIRVLDPLEIRELITAVIRFEDSLGTGTWPAVSDSLIMQVLDTLKFAGIVNEVPAYVSGGMVLYRDEQGGLKQERNVKDLPFFWPLAHDVRSAAQSLGSDGCTDCHTADAPFFFGEVVIDEPLAEHAPIPVTMSDIQNKSSLQRKIFAASFLFRPWLKGLLIGVTILTMLILLIYLIRGLNALLYIIRQGDP